MIDDDEEHELLTCVWTAAPCECVPTCACSLCVYMCTCMSLCLYICAYVFVYVIVFVFVYVLVQTLLRLLVKRTNISGLWMFRANFDYLLSQFHEFAQKQVFS